MTSSWKAIYPWIQSALLTCQSLEEFCEQAIAQVASTYHATGWLWVGLENPETVQVYRSHDNAPEPKDEVLPGGMSWLTDQHPSLQITQLHTGDLVIPMIHPVQPTVTTGDSVAHQVALQLRRMPVQDEAKPAILLTDNRAQTAVYGWSAEELNSLEIIASQIGLAYELFQTRQQMYQARQQIALLSRTAYLLNSNLPLETQLIRLLTDWGYSIDSDRGLVVRLRDRVAVPIATWNISPSSHEAGLDAEALWQDAIDLFEDGAASHLELYSTSAVDDEDELHHWLTKQGCEAGILMPIRIRGEFFGIVGLFSTAIRSAYRVDELQLLRQATEQLAIALAALYQPDESVVEPWGDSKALYDSLTGCETRVALEQTLEQMRMRVDWTITATSLILCNLDYFKLVNDTYGHNVGDQVLQAVAHRLREHLRHPSKVYRYGGEEFAIILTSTPYAAAMRVAERLRWAIGDTPIRTSAGDIAVTASFGVAQQPITRDGDEWVMFQEAEAAIQEAKRQGRNQVIGR